MLAWRHEIADGQLLGPQLFSSGAKFEGIHPVWQGTIEVGPAWFGRLNRYGAVAPGKAADLVLLEKNPLTDINATRAINTVMLRGQLFDRTALDALLEETRAKVTA